MYYMSDETRVDSYIAARYRRPAGDLPVGHVLYTCLGNRDFSLHVHVYTIPYTYTVYTSIFKAYTVYCTGHLLINNTMKNLSARMGRP